MEILNKYRDDTDLLYVVEGSELSAEELSSDILSGLQELGLNLSADASEGYDSSSDDAQTAAASLNLIAVIDSGDVKEQLVSTSLTGLTYEGTISGLRLELAAAGFLGSEGNRLPEDYTFFRGDTTYTEEVMTLQGGSYLSDASGIRIAVYNKETKKMIDCMALSEDGTTVTHQE